MFYLLVVLLLIIFDNCNCDVSIRKTKHITPPMDAR